MRARLLFSAAFALLCLPLFLLQADNARIQTQVVQVLLPELELALDAPIEVRWPSLDASAEAEGADALRAGVRLGQDSAITPLASREGFRLEIPSDKPPVRNISRLSQLPEGVEKL